MSVNMVRWLFRATNTIVENFKPSVVETSILVTSVLTLPAKKLAKSSSLRDSWGSVECSHYSVRLGTIHGLKVIHGSQRVEREPGNEASTVKMHWISLVLQKPTVQITDFMFIDVGKTPPDWLLVAYYG